MDKDFMIKTKEIPFSDPLSIFEKVQHQQWALFLDSATYDLNYGRYSYIVFDPFKVLLAKDGQISIDGEPVPSHHNPLTLLKELLNQMPDPHVPELPPFQGGAAGVFAYDLYQYIEPMPTKCVDELDFPDLAIGFYDVVISFDAHQKMAWIVSTGWPEKTPAAKLIRATERLNEFAELLNTYTDKTSTDHLEVKNSITPSTKIAPNISSNFDASTYCKAVSRAMNYILEGDIFEVNISQRFKSLLPPTLSPFQLYRRLREKNPAPFSAFMNLGDIHVVSASPERFLQLNHGIVETRPIKGTRPRDADPIIDSQLANELKTSEKDHAENVMIVDLLRNDLSIVCEENSINVTQLCELESYATVHHLVSVVTGKLKDNHDAIDLFISTFPGGSITGAPKIRAMQIIAEIEPTKRGLYCGSIGFIGFNGTMDTSIAIRTYTIKNDIVTFQAGGAVVVESDPKEEYLETLTKSAALHDALLRQT